MKKICIALSIFLILCGCKNIEEPAKLSTVITAKCVDEDNNPVSGATIQFCDDSMCSRVVSDDEGIASFEGEFMSCTVHAAGAPEGYSLKTEEEKTVLGNKDIELTFIFLKE